MCRLLQSISGQECVAGDLVHCLFDGLSDYLIDRLNFEIYLKNKKNDDDLYNVLRNTFKKKDYIQRKMIIN